MPTTVTNSIGPGKTYATIQAWMTAAGTTYPGGLVAADVIWKGELYPSSGGNEWSFTTSNTWPSITTDATRYFYLTAAPTHSFKDNAAKLTNALKYNTANGVSFIYSGTFTELFSGGSAFFLIEGLQIKNNGGSFTSNANSGGRASFKDCILHTATLRFESRITNCLLIQSFCENTVSEIRNCTFVGFSSGNAIGTNNYSSVLVKNCAFFGHSSVTDNASKIVAASSTYNATDLASFGWTATGNIVSKTYANQFQSITSGSEDFRVKAGADLINAGVRDQTYTGDLDIVGSARSTTTPTIGAWEFPSVTYTYARPSSDITTQWTPSTGTAHFSLINETTASDADYIFATAAGQTDEVRLASMSAPQAGTDLKVNYRVQGIVGSASVTLSLVCNTTVIATDTTRTFNGDYTLTVASGTWASVADWTNMRLRFVSA